MTDVEPQWKNHGDGFGKPRKSTRLRQTSPRQAARDRDIDRAIAEAKRRDGYRCQADARGIVPEVDCLGRREGQHVIPRGVRPDLATDVDNIVTLCLAHHQWAGTHPVLARALGLHGRSGDR